jgi:hypothetical protein
VEDLVLPVPANGNKAGTKLRSQEYVIGDVSQENPFKPFKGTQLTVAKSGLYDVHVKLTDSEDVVTIRTIQVHIDYDQKRY